jgi:TRAP-type C4-dicarboxylate transport system permease small subunit
MTLKQFINTIERWYYPVVRFFDRLTWVVLFVMMSLTMADVLLRKIVNHSILGTVELTELMLVLVVFCSLAKCQVDDGHIKIDFIMRNFSQKTQKLVDVFTQFSCFVLFLFMTYGTYRYAVDMREWEEVTLDLGIKVYPFVYLLCFGCALLALVLLLKSLKALSEVAER